MAGRLYWDDDALDGSTGVSLVWFDRGGDGLRFWFLRLRLSGGAPPPSSGSIIGLVKF